MNIIKQWPVFFLLLAFAIAPLFHGIETGILVAIHILVLAVFINVFLASHQKFRIPYNSLSLSICLFYLWIALSISWSPSPSASLYMFVWLSVFPLCFFIYSLKKPDDWSYLPVGILCVTLVFAFIGIGQGVFLKETHIPSLFLTQNTHAAMINLIALPITAFFISSKQTYNRLTILLGIILFILFFAVFQTASKGGFVSLLSCLVFLFFISWKHIEKSSSLKVLIILITAFLLANIETSDLIINRLRNQVSSGASNPSVSVRLLIWQSAWDIIKTTPLLGIGIGAFAIIFPAFRKPAIEEDVYFVHNDYLQILVETGFIGLSLMLLIMGIVGMLIKRLLNHQKLIFRDRVEASGLMAGLCTIGVHSFVDFNFYIIAILMIIGLMCARIQEISLKYFPKMVRVFIPAHKLSKNIFILISLVIPFVLLSYSLPVAIADYYMQKANEQLRIKQIEKATLTLSKAALLNPGSIRIRVKQFSLFRSILIINKNDASPIKRKAYLARALLALNEIENINPLEPFVYEGRGYLLVENSDIVVDNWHEKAVHEFKKALQFQPIRYGSRLALAKLLSKQNKLNEAVALMNDGVNYNYQHNLPRLGEFYRYAVELNLLKGDTIQAGEIQIKLDDVELYYNNLSPRD